MFKDKPINLHTGREGKGAKKMKRGDIKQGEWMQ